mgnify:CR=1 FL=1
MRILVIRLIQSHQRPLLWRTLQDTKNIGHEKKRVCVSEVINPKAITVNEMYGYMTLAKDWKDGILSIIMRGMAKNDRDLGYTETQTNKWIVLDGDVDTLWIESMNTVMDANKVLTLVSNERIPLTPQMRMGPAHSWIPTVMECMITKKSGDVPIVQH